MPDLKSYAEYNDRILAAARDNNIKDGIAVLSSPAYMESTRAISDGIIRIRDLKSISAARKNEAGAKEGNFAVFLSITLTVVGMILAVVLGMIVSRLISRPVEELAKKAGQIAEGDLSVSVDVSSRDEIGQLSASFASMVENLRTLIGQVGSASDHVASAATELTSTSEQITRGAQEVASQSSAVASAGEEMAATSKDIARNCQVAVQEGKEASDAAQAGVEVVNRTVEVMGRIAAASIRPPGPSRISVPAPTRSAPSSTPSRRSPTRPTFSP
jgi:methyl-accepting chemotaxis protein